MTRDASELISAYLDDQLTDAEFAELQQWMSADAAHLRQFVRESLVHSRIRDLLHQREVCDLAFDVDGAIDPDRIVSLLDEEAAAERQRRRLAELEALRAAEAAARRHELEFDRNSLRVDPPQTPWRWYVGATIAAAILVGVAQLLLPDPPLTAPVHQAPIAAAPAVVGTIRASLDAAWDAPELAVAVGSPVVSGNVALTRGVVEIEFTSGAQIVVEAPAALQLVSADRVRLQHGRVVVHVPEEALGFTLHSNHASFVDLGTEFGVEVTDAGAASIHVLDGEVALVRGDRAAEKASRMLKRGAASTVSADGATVQDIPFEASHFFRRVPATAYELAVRRSRPLFYWRMSDEDGSGAIESEGRLLAPGKAMVGVQLDAVGYEENSRAANFSRIHRGVELGRVPELDLVANFTCEAWARSTAQPLQVNGIGPQRILSTFDRSPRTGFAFGLVDGRWYGQPTPGLSLHFTAHGVYDCITTASAASDEWVHLALVVGANGEPSMYLNGEASPLLFRDTFGEVQGRWFLQQDGSAQFGHPSPGAACIGWNPQGQENRIPHERFEGWLSDVAVYDRALSPEEVGRHFHAARRGDD